MYMYIFIFDSLSTRAAHAHTCIYPNLFAHSFSLKLGRVVVGEEEEEEEEEKGST